MIMLWDSLRKNGYKRSYTNMVRVVDKWIKSQIKKKQARKSQPYVRAEYPGQKVQIDVKFVPVYCVNGKVERQLRTDENRFYKKMKMYSLADGRAQLAKYNKKSNNIRRYAWVFLLPMRYLINTWE